MTRKFQPRLQGIQSATAENLTEAAQIADSWKGYCEDLYCDEEGKGIEQEYWEQEPPPLRSDVARAIRQTASRKATGPDEVPAELFIISLQSYLLLWVFHHTLTIFCNQGPKVREHIQSNCSSCSFWN